MEELNSSFEKCALCYEEYTNRNIVITECGHKYHAQCLMMHARRHTECPMCLTALYEKFEGESEEQQRIRNLELQLARMQCTVNSYKSKLKTAKECFETYKKDNDELLEKLNNIKRELTLYMPAKQRQTCVESEPTEMCTTEHMFVDPATIQETVLNPMPIQETFTYVPAYVETYENERLALKRKADEQLIIQQCTTYIRDAFVGAQQLVRDCELTSPSNQLLALENAHAEINGMLQQCNVHMETLAKINRSSVVRQMNKYLNQIHLLNARLQQRIQDATV